MHLARVENLIPSFDQNGGCMCLGWVHVARAPSFVHAPAGKGRQLVSFRTFLNVFVDWYSQENQRKTGRGVRSKQQIRSSVDPSSRQVSSGDVQRSDSRVTMTERHHLTRVDSTYGCDRVALVQPWRRPWRPSAIVIERRGRELYILSFLISFRYCSNSDQRYWVSFSTSFVVSDVLKCLLRPHSTSSFLCRVCVCDMAAILKLSWDAEIDYCTWLADSSNIQVVLG